MVVASTSTVMTTSTTPMWSAVVTLSMVASVPATSFVVETSGATATWWGARSGLAKKRDRGWRNTVAASFANGLAQADGIRHFDEVEARMVCQLGL